MIKKESLGGRIVLETKYRKIIAFQNSEGKEEEIDENCKFFLTAFSK